MKRDGDTTDLPDRFDQARFSDDFDAHGHVPQEPFDGAKLVPFRALSEVRDGHDANSSVVVEEVLVEMHFEFVALDVFDSIDVEELLSSDASFSAEAGFCPDDESIPWGRAGPVGDGEVGIVIEHGLGEMVDPFGGESSDVGIHEEEYVACAFSDAPQERLVFAEVCFVSDDFDFGERSCDIACVVGGTVIDDDDFIGAFGV